MFLPFPFPSARILEFTGCPAAQRGPLPSWQQWNHSGANICLPHPTPFPKLRIEEQKTVSPHNALCCHLTSTSRQKTAARPLSLFSLFFFKQRKSHLPLEEVDSVNNIPAILAQVLLKLPQDISNPGCIVQVHLQRVLQEEWSMDFHNLGRLNKAGKKKKVLKERLLSVKPSSFKADWRVWRIKPIQTAVQGI